MKFPNENVLVGKVEKLERLKGTIHLSTAQVSIGKKDSLQIVCGAPNIKVGQKVVVALPGTQLKNPKDTKEPLTVSEVVIKGVKSEGVICSAYELSISDDHSGIVILKDGTEIGLAFLPESIKIKKVKGSKVNTDPKEIEEFVTRGVVDVITKEELTKKMSSGKKLRAYIGYDVTGPDLHIGHGSTLLKLKHWQDLGHQVVLVIGDDTSRIGDHSDKLEKRKRLTNKEIDFNKSQFKEQFGKIIDLDKTEVRYNSEWLDELRFRNVIELASLFSVQQMIERENFAKRLKSQQTIGLEEILYPLMQGYDSVALKVDLEMGATDQRFNLLAGRKIQEAYDMPPQNVITVPFVTGTDGRKMSKSWNNFIPMRASAVDLFAGIMSSVDEVIIEYFTRLTRIPMDEIAEMEKALKEGKIHPMELKKRLAFEVTSIYHDAKSAQKAQEHFERTVQGGETPDDIRRIEVRIQESGNKNELEIVTRDENSFEIKGTLKALDLAKFLVTIGIIGSNADAKRLIEQGGLWVNDTQLGKFDEKIRIESEMIVKAGKRNFLKIIVNQ